MLLVIFKTQLQREFKCMFVGEHNPISEGIKRENKNSTIWEYQEVLRIWMRSCRDGQCQSFQTRSSTKIFNYSTFCVNNIITY